MLRGQYISNNGNTFGLLSSFAECKTEICGVNSMKGSTCKLVEDRLMLIKEEYPNQMYKIVCQYFTNFNHRQSVNKMD